MELYILISVLTPSLRFITNMLVTFLYSSIYPTKRVMKEFWRMQLWHLSMGEKEFFLELLVLAGAPSPQFLRVCLQKFFFAIRGETLEG